jgi:hypothetical protein
MYGYEGHVWCYVSADVTSRDLELLDAEGEGTPGTACQRTHRNIPEYWNLREPHISQTCLEASTFLHSIFIFMLVP